MTAVITTAATGTETWTNRGMCGGATKPRHYLFFKGRYGDGHVSTAILVPDESILHRTNQLAVCLLAGLACGAATSSRADPVSLAPTRQDCEAAVERARALASTLPANDPSRYFAERDLHQALVEAGNGEFDDCMEMAERATEEVREHRHVLFPGETLKVLRPDENSGR